MRHTKRKRNFSRFIVITIPCIGIVIVISLVLVFTGRMSRPVVYRSDEAALDEAEAMWSSLTSLADLSARLSSADFSTRSRALSAMMMHKHELDAAHGMSFARAVSENSQVLLGSEHLASVLFLLENAKLEFSIAAWRYWLCDGDVEIKLHDTPGITSVASDSLRKRLPESQSYMLPHDSTVSFSALCDYLETIDDAR